MKKSFHILLAAVSLLSALLLMTACGKQEPAVTPEPPVSEAPAPSAPAQPEPAEEIPFDAGALVNDQYTNSWADISLAVPEGMTPLSPEEMADRFSQTDNLMSGEAAQAEKLAGKPVQDAFIPLFMLESPPESTDRLKVLLSVEYTSDISSPEEYLEKTLEQISPDGSPMKFTEQPTEVQLGGQTYLHAVLAVQDGFIQYDVRSVEDGFLVLSIGYDKDLETNALAASFLLQMPKKS